MVGCTDLIASNYDSLACFNDGSCYYVTDCDSTCILYSDEIFNDVIIHSNVNYGTNVSVLPLLLGAPPSPTPLLCDIYEPLGGFKN